MSDFDTIPASIKQRLMTELCERIEDAIFILDENLRYLSVNPSYELLIGYKEEFLIGRPLGIYAAEFLSEAEQVILKDIKKNLNEHGFYELDFSMANRYGQNIDCHITYRRIYIDQMAYHIGMLRDMSAVIKDQKQVAHLLNYDQLTVSLTASISTDS